MTKRSSFLRLILHYREYLLMLLPAVAFFIVFSYIPMAGIIIAFKDYSFSGGIFGSQWVGLHNLKFLFLNNDLIKVVRNTVGYNIAFIVVNNALEIFCAVVLAEIRNKYFKKATQTIMLLPYFISWVVVGGLTYNLFNYEHGFINNIVHLIGGSSIDFYNVPLYWVPIIIFVSAWKYVGYGTVVYLATIAGIDPGIYEAAEIDGASTLQRTVRITIPMLIPTTIILVLLSLGNIFRGDFSMYYQLVGNNSMLWSTTDVIDTFVTRSLLQSNDIGMSSAAGFFQSVLGFATIIIANMCIRAYDKEYSLF
jgi:putative aldouronate transport system permease protein